MDFQNPGTRYTLHEVRGLELTEQMVSLHFYVQNADCVNAQLMLSGVGGGGSECPGMSQLRAS